MANRLRRRTSDQMVLGSNSGHGRCVESLDKASLLPLSQGEAFTLASISYLAILVKYILAKKKKKKFILNGVWQSCSHTSHSVDYTFC